MQSAALDLFEQTADTVRTALSLQGQWMRSWADLVDRSARLLQSQQQWQKAAMDSAAAASRSTQASVDMLERTSHTGIAWMQRALDVAAAPFGLNGAKARRGAAA